MLGTRHILCDASPRHAAVLPTHHCGCFLNLFSRVIADSRHASNVFKCIKTIFYCVININLIHCRQCPARTKGERRGGGRETGKKGEGEKGEGEKGEGRGERRRRETVDRRGEMGEGEKV